MRNAGKYIQILQNIKEQVLKGEVFLMIGCDSERAEIIVNYLKSYGINAFSEHMYVTPNMKPIYDEIDGEIGISGREQPKRKLTGYSFFKM